MRTIIRNGNVLDTEAMAFVGERTVVIEKDRIVAVGEAPSGPADREIDAEGGFVMPGFVDGHAHFRLATMDFHRLSHWSEVEYGIAMAELASATLERGFTTVRDLGGDVSGLMRAIATGMVRGPRIVPAGRMLTQTGGHGDIDGGPRAVPDCACQMPHTAFSIIADGVDAVRKAARHNLRDGSAFLKLHVSGGVASPSDPLDSVQYTPAEIGAAVEEAAHRHTYVAAHAYSPESIRMAVEAGVHTIEHGNLLDAEIAAVMAARGAVLVPTLCTYEAMRQVGEELGLPAKNREKNEIVFEAGLKSLALAREAGVERGFGTDLIGETQIRQNREFAIRAEVESPREILQAMYRTNVRLCHLEDRIGVIAPDAHADLVIARRNPLEDIRVLADPAATLATVIAGGREVPR